MPSTIEVSNLVKTYGDGTKAVKGISFSVNEGEFFGFLGPNGAGKSTTIKILTTILTKTSGAASVAGLNVDTDSAKIRKIIGVQNQDTVVDEDLTGRENMILQGQLQQMHGPALNDRVNELLKVVDLVDAADKRAGFYSGGMKKRLDLATTLVHDPKILFLDEPTTGLDPQSRAAIWAYLKRLNEQGITIFITTQYLEEVDRLCRRLAIVDLGEIVAQGTPGELKQEIGADSISLGFESSAMNGGDTRVLAREVLSKRFSDISNIVNSDIGLTVYAKNGGYMVPEIVRAFDDAKIHLASIGVSSPTLDDVFLKHTGKRIRVEEVSSMNSRGMFGRRRR
ncbi:MAG TPA: ATP-binding cassette domain-containing protein [Candidatus Bathyarchaeia archaeon]|nr:ATP-binding cassette domain-containing protein [Candidatus Bathyarchaeia archaeon]